MQKNIDFTSIPLAPADPILGVTEQFLKDTRPNKVNLGVGVYQNENGKAAKLNIVKKAESILLENDLLATYSPIDGQPEFRANAQEVVFGKDHTVLKDSRVVTVQSPGGTGAIRLGAEFLKQFAAGRDVYISNPSWDNHQAIFRACSFNVIQYPYYSSEKKGLDFDKMFSSLENAKDGSIVVLHAACHNPTGYDLSDDQWKNIIELSEKKSLILFLDIAYQGFLNSLEDDPKIIRQLANTNTNFLVASSFSKNLGMYAERIGALHIITDSKDSALKVQSQVKQIVRTIYSNPPARGSKIFNTIWMDSTLRTEWISELNQMKDRIKKMRTDFVSKTKSSGIDFDFSHVMKQNGMFSYSGLSKENVLWMREHCGLYALESGRICVAALNDNNINYVIESISKALKNS
jgi:aromatic-amino-acid transaminase